MIIRISFLLTVFSLNLFAGVKHEKQVYWGTATNEKGDIAYVEKHTITKKNGTLINSETIYFDKDKTNIIATLISDYSNSLSLPTYEFLDKRSNYREGLRLEEEKYVIYYQKPNEKEEREILEEKERVFSCQGWHYFLINNLEILEKEDIALKLVLPSSLDFYSFKVEQVQASGSRVEAKLKLASWILRLFAPTLRLVYDKKIKKLMEYEGISNVLDKDGDRQEVKIVYDYADKS